MNSWFAASYIFLWILVVVSVVFTAITFRQLGVFIMGSARGIHDSGIPIGRRVPDIPLKTFDGGSWLPGREAGSPYILFFGATYCKDCASILPIARRLEGSGLRIVFLIFQKDFQEGSRYAREMDIWTNAIPIDQAIGHRFDVAAVPFAYAVDRNGIIRAKGLAGTVHQLQQLVVACGANVDQATWRETVIRPSELVGGSNRDH
jgi:methylamine dehydrogenase accessory protein MauD